MKKISAIICAYNEASTIKDVVATVSDYFFDEVIVVNDGSTDKTDSILKGINGLYNFKYIFLSENKGKGFAMATGIENTSSEIIVFIDADLTNLQEEHFVQLITPVLSKEADMVLGQATATLINYGVNPFKSLTGERALLKKDILPIVDKMKHSRFGVETLINLYYQSTGKTVKYVMLKGLVHPTKFQKTSVIKASKQFVSEGREIAITAFNNYDLMIKSIRNLIIGQKNESKN
ncbi:MAG: glycosyltransferase family 2 protein [Bacteroidales bacterium]|nr:glycosyltransferase family 2 protein [Bacteroidales bacterium]